MKIKMLNTAITVNNRLDKGGEDFFFDTEFIVSGDKTTTLSQVYSLLNSFVRLTETHSRGEISVDMRMITLDKTKKKGIFTVKTCFFDEICFDEFLCETDDFQTFKWYARKVDIEEKAEDFKPIK